MYKQLKVNMVEALRQKDFFTRKILSTFISEAEAKSVDKSGKRVEPTDAIIVATAKKFKVGVVELLAMPSVTGDTRIELEMELAFYDRLIPKAVTADEIKAFLASDASVLGQGIGACMAKLRERFGTALDGKVASAIAKEMIVG